jgi:hypothetical protein
MASFIHRKTSKDVCREKNKKPHKGLTIILKDI